MLALWLAVSSNLLWENKRIKQKLLHYIFINQKKKNQPYLLSHELILLKLIHVYRLHQCRLILLYLFLQAKGLVCVCVWPSIFSVDNFSSRNAEVENYHTENHMLKIGALLEEKWECSFRHNRLLFSVHKLVNAFLRKL